MWLNILCSHSFLNYRKCCSSQNKTFYFFIEVYRESYWVFSYTMGNYTQFTVTNKNTSQFIQPLSSPTKRINQIADAILYSCGKTDYSKQTPITMLTFVHTYIKNPQVTLRGHLELLCGNSHIFMDSYHFRKIGGPATLALAHQFRLWWWDSSQAVCKCLVPHPKGNGYGTSVNQL